MPSRQANQIDAIRARSSRLGLRPYRQGTDACQDERGQRDHCQTRKQVMATPSCSQRTNDARQQCRQAEGYRYDSIVGHRRIRRW